jgi:hypothetical protein
VVCIGVNRMDVRDLNDSEQRQQCQAHQHEHNVSSWPRVAITAHPCMKSGQTQSSLEGPLLQEYTELDARRDEMSQSKTPLR